MTLATARADRVHIEVDEPDAVFCKDFVGLFTQLEINSALVVALVETTTGHSIETCTRMDLLTVLQQLLRLLQLLRTPVGEKRSCGE